MVESGILKNISKFKNMTFLNWVDLTQYKYITRERSDQTSYSGVSTITFGDRWFLTPKGKALFKSFDGEYVQNLRKLRIANEMIIEEICHQINLPCVTYVPAKLYYKYGLITYDITDKNHILVDMNHLFEKEDYLMPNFVNLSYYLPNKTKKDKKNKTEIITNVFKALVLDLLTLQTDRHSGNVNLLMNKSTGEYTFAPLFDNEFAFGLERLNQFISEDNLNKVEFNSLLKEHSFYSKIFPVDNSFFSNSSTKARFKYNVEQMVNFAKKYNNLMLELENILTKIDIDKAVEKVEKDIKINSYYKEYMKTIVTNTKNMFHKALSADVSKEDLDELDKIL